MAQKRFDEKTKQEIGDLYSTGLTTTDLAKRFGCNPTTIAGFVREQGLARGRGFGRFPAIVRRYGEQIMKSYIDGLSTEEIAREVDIDSHTVKRILRSKDVQLERRPRTRERHPGWKGGRYVNDHGYVEVIDDDPRFASMRGADGYTPEHRFVMARALGRPLRRDESVHHVDGNRQNNQYANLELRQGKHGSGVVLQCRDCGSHNVEAVRLNPC